MKTYLIKQLVLSFFNNLFISFAGVMFLSSIIFTYLIHYGIINFILNDIKNASSNEILKEIIFYNLLIQIWIQFTSQIQYIFPIYYLQNFVMKLRLKLFKKAQFVKEVGKLVEYDNNLKSGMENIIQNIFFRIPFALITFLICSIKLKSFYFIHLILIIIPFVFIEIILSYITYRYERRIVKLNYDLKNNLIKKADCFLYKKHLNEYKDNYIISSNIQAGDGIFMRLLFSFMQFIFLYYVIFNNSFTVKENSKNVAHTIIILNEMGNGIRFLSLSIRNLILNIYRVKDPLNIIH